MLDPGGENGQYAGDTTLKIAVSPCAVPGEVAGVTYDPNEGGQRLRYRSVGLWRLGTGPGHDVSMSCPGYGQGAKLLRSAHVPAPSVDSAPDESSTVMV